MFDTKLYDGNKQRVKQSCIIKRVKNCYVLMQSITLHLLPSHDCPPYKEAWIIQRSLLCQLHLRLSRIHFQPGSPIHKMTRDLWRHSSKNLKGDVQPSYCTKINKMKLQAVVSLTKQSTCFLPHLQFFHQLSPALPFTDPNTQRLRHDKVNAGV